MDPTDGCFSNESTENWKFREIEGGGFEGIWRKQFAPDHHYYEYLPSLPAAPPPAQVCTVLPIPNHRVRL